MGEDRKHACSVGDAGECAGTFFSAGQHGRNLKTIVNSTLNIDYDNISATNFSEIVEKYYNRETSAVYVLSTFLFDTRGTK